MKYIKLIVLVILFGAFTSIEAQTFGHINSQELLSTMPEMQQAEKELETYSQQLENDLARRAEAWQQEAAKLQQDNQAGIITPQQAESRAQQLEITRNELLQSEQDAKIKVLQKQEELLAPIIEKAQKAVADVAAEKGLSYVFDLSIGSVIHFPPGDDISAAVKAKMGF